MAKNRVYEEGDRLPLTVPAGTVSGTPVMVGQIPGVSVIDRDAATGRATVHMDGVYTLSVRGINAATNTAIAEGDILFFDAARNPALDVTPADRSFGYVLELVAAGATATIMVKIGY